MFVKVCGRFVSLYLCVFMRWDCLLLVSPCPCSCLAPVHYSCWCPDAGASFNGFIVMDLLRACCVLAPVFVNERVFFEIECVFYIFLSCVCVADSALTLVALHCWNLSVLFKKTQLSLWTCELLNKPLLFSVTFCFLFILHSAKKIHSGDLVVT